MTLVDIDKKLEEIYRKKDKNYILNYSGGTEFWIWINEVFLFEFKKNDYGIKREEYFYILMNYKNENENSIFTYKEFKELNNKMFEVFNLDDFIFVINNLKKMKENKLHLNKKGENFLLFNSFSEVRKNIMNFLNSIENENIKIHINYVENNFENFFNSLEKFGEELLKILNKEKQKINEEEKYFEVNTNQNCYISYDEDNIIIKFPKKTKLKIKR